MKGAKIVLYALIAIVVIEIGVFLLVGCSRAINTDDTINKVEVIPEQVKQKIFYVTSFQPDGTVLTKEYDSMIRGDSGCYIGNYPDGRMDYYPIQSTWIEMKFKD
jgi:hypothetical protein